MEGEGRSKSPLTRGDDDGDGRPRAGGGCAPLPVVESLIGHMRTEAYKGPGERLIGPQFIAYFEFKCAEAGLINEIDGTFFDRFPKLSELEMRAFITSSFIAFWTFIKPMIEDVRTTGHRLEAEMFIESALYMAVRGNVRFLTYPCAELCRAVGPRPTPEQQRRILERIRSDHPLQTQALRDLLAAERKASAVIAAMTKSHAHE